MLAKPKVTKVTGGAGTLKRKRQLRDALEEMDKDYYDDVFESTPFKKFKKSVTVRQCVSYFSLVCLYSGKCLWLIYNYQCRPQAN